MGKFDKWHGIDRKKIPWYPTIRTDKCISCKLCFVTCGRLVFDWDDVANKPIVARPYNCMVGCTTCAAICPAQAIEFPDPEIVRRIEREEKILAKMHELAKKKKMQISLTKARQIAEELLAKNKTYVKFEATGHFIERGIISKMDDALKDKPCDIVNLSLEVSSLKGCKYEKAPSLLKFNLVSTKFEDVGECRNIIRKILTENDAVVTLEQ